MAKKKQLAPRVHYAVFVQIAPYEHPYLWELFESFDSRLGCDQAHKRAVRSLRKKEPLNVNNGATDYRLVIVPESPCGDVRGWAD